MEDSINNELLWLSNWFADHCNGDWEHENQVRIYTVDNPGWVVKVDLGNTVLEGLDIDYQLHESNDSDWYGFSVKKGVFKGVGDLNKLPTLIQKFIEIVQNYSHS